MTKCEACGLESDFEAGFIKARRSFRSGRHTLCPRCWTDRLHKREAGFQIAVAAAGVIGFVLLWLNPYSFVGQLLRTAFLINLFLLVSIVPHELGHGLMARALGWKVFRIVVGIGRPVFKCRLIGFDFEFRSIPIGGVTLLGPGETKWLRLKLFLTVLAGPLVNAALAAAVVMIWGRGWAGFEFDELPTVARLFFFANVWVLVFNLIPYQHKSILDTPSDGKQLLQAYFLKPSRVQEMHAASFAMEAMTHREQKDLAGARDWCERGINLYPESFPLLNLAGIVALDAHDYERARAIFLQLLDRENGPGLPRYLMLNNIAYADALSGNPCHQDEAEAFSREAYQGLPWVPAIAGTRGTVLVTRGEYEAGLKLLRQSLEATDDPRHKAENACWLAIGHWRSSNREQARSFLELARKLDVACNLLARAEQEMNSGHDEDCATVTSGS